MNSDTGKRVEDTRSVEYADFLKKKQRVWWKRLLDVQAPYRWNIRRLNPGFILDIGCGIGRNLIHLNGQGVGIDHNEQAVRTSRELGLKAFTPEEFQNTDYAHHLFDTILLAHVAEHMTQREVVRLLQGYLHLLKPGGKLIIITPQEAGYRSDPTHVEFMDFAKVREINSLLDFPVLQEYSFPFPRLAGRIFKYNEFVSVSLNARP